MKYRSLHSWDVDYKAAVAIQADLRERLILEDRLPGDIRIVAGADISCTKGDDRLPGDIRIVAGADISCTKGDDRLFAAVVLLDAATLDVIEEATYSGKTSIPYIPGLLSFREGPALLRAFEKLRNRPDVILFDGQGIAHPRGFGLAAHMGLILDVPSVGCAKTRLVGTFREPGGRRGQHSPLHCNEKRIGAVLRTKDRVKPVFVSQGHRVSLESAVKIVLQCARRYRIPEPIRRAHILVNKMRVEGRG